MNTRTQTHRSPALPPATEWHSAHVYYHAQNKDALILDAVRPLFGSLRDTVKAAHLGRHWRQGPHLRLHLRTDPATWREAVQPRIESMVGGYLRTHPSTAVLDRRAEYAQHQLLAQREQECGPLSPWFPDNSIQYPPYDARLHVLHDQETADLLAAFATDSTPLLFRTLEHARNGKDTKESLALDLLLTTAVAVLPTIQSSVTSFRAHAEGFLHQCGDPDAVRASFDAYYRTRRERLTARVSAVVAALDGGEPMPFIREWSELADTYAERVAPMIERGLVFDRITVPTSGPLLKSPFHVMMFGNRAYVEQVFNNPAFLRYRFLINCTYLQVSRLGLGPAERFRLCHLAANATEDTYGLSAIDRVRTFVERHPNP